MTDDGDTSALVRRAQGGDEQAFGELAERFRGMVYQVALKHLRNWADAEDLTQDALVRALEKLSQLEDPHCFPGWLRQITVGLALNRITRQRRPLPLPENDPEAPSTD